MKKLFAAAAALLISLSLCACQKTDKAYNYAFFDVFDTVTEITVYAGSEPQALAAATAAHGKLVYLNKLFDIYNEYDDAVSLKTVNSNAAQGSVSVPQETIALLEFAKQAHELTRGNVNAAMGSVLAIWHDYREAGLNAPAQAALPPMEELRAAAEHTDIESIVIDKAACSVYFTDKLTRLDVGALAKGFAAQLTANELQTLIDNGSISAALISLGGNVCAIGSKPNGSAWQIAVQAPRGSGNAGIVEISSGSVVTSGDYQRYYTVDGVDYNHIIDPQTLMSANKFAAVTVVCQNSALADALSTALFIMDIDEGRALIEGISGAQALWIMPDGQMQCTDGFNME